MSCNTPTPSIGSNIPNRVRIRTHPPLQPIQAWIPFDPTQQIRSLKSQIIESFGHHQPSIPIEPQDVRLELDGFAFLDQSLCSLINPAHDLIDVKVVDAPSQSSKKRARSQTKALPDSQTSPQQHLQPTDGLLQRCMSQTVERTTEASQPRASLEREADHSRLIKPLPSSNVAPQVSNPKDSKAEQKPPAPPGQGKASTKARNRRKKRKKEEARALKKLESGATDPNQSILPAPSTNNSQSTIPPLNQTESNANGSTTVTPNQPEQRPNQPQLQTSHSAEKETESDELSQSGSSEESESSSSDSSSLSSSSSFSSSSSSSSFESSESHSSVSDSASSALSSSPPQAAEKISNNSEIPAQIIQKKVPIIPNPELAMLSLSNKNKRKNVKRHIDPVVQTNKIVFEFPDLKNQAPSPSYMPCSPGLHDQSHDTPSLNIFKPTNYNQVETVAVHEEYADEYMYGDDSVATTVMRSHGPPPSARDPKLIPSNVLITSVNVLNPYWTPGQIGKQQDWIVSAEAAHQTCSRTKKNRKNRKKALKRRRRAARSKLLSQQGQAASDNDDDVEDDDDVRTDEDDIQNDVEEAYQEFINSGGHGHQPISTDQRMSCELQAVKPSEGSLANQIHQLWDQLVKVDQQNIELGSQVVIRTIELSLESFTPEMTIYYGTVMASTATHLVLKLDPKCIPSSCNSVEYQEQDQDGPEDDEARSAVRKESIRAHQRDALMNDLWGHSGDTREWEWSAIDGVRKL